MRIWYTDHRLYPTDRHHYSRTHVLPPDNNFISFEINPLLLRNYLESSRRHVGGGSIQRHQDNYVQMALGVGKRMHFLQARSLGFVFFCADRSAVVTDEYLGRNLDEGSFQKLLPDKKKRVGRSTGLVCRPDRHRILVWCKKWESQPLERAFCCTGIIFRTRIYLRLVTQLSEP